MLTIFNRLACKKIRSFIWKYIDEKPSLKESDMISKHTSSCDPCLYVYNDVQEMMKLLRTIQKEKVPAGFSTGIINRIRIENNQKNKVHLPHYLVFSGSMLALILVMLMYSQTGFPGTRIFFKNKAAMEDLYKGGIISDGKSGYLELNLNCAEKMEDINIEFMLPDGIVLNNGKRQEIWKGDLQKGPNIILVKVRGVASGTGYVKGVIRKADKSKDFIKEVRII